METAVKKDSKLDKDTKFAILVTIAVVVAIVYNIIAAPPAKVEPVSAPLATILSDAAQGKVVSATLDPNDNEVVTTTHDGQRYTAFFPAGQGDQVAEELAENHVTLTAVAPKPTTVTPPEIRIPPQPDDD